MKLCKKCNETKPLESFCKDSTRTDGHAAYCRSCVSTYKKQHAQANKDKLAKYQKEYYKANKPKLQQYHKDYLQSGGAEVRKKYRQDNKEQIKILKSNNETKRSKAKTYSALSGPDYRVWVSNELKICSYCGIDCTGSFHVDHIEPLAHGGKHELDNLTISCPACNLSKGAKSLIVFLAYKSLGNKPTEVKDKKP